MEYRRLGRSGIRLSEIGLGSWLTYGEGVDDETSRECIRVAYDNGINFFDTADIYARGGAEEFLGDALQEFRRQDLVIASKCFMPMSENPNDRGLSRKHVCESVENSLRRLKTDYIDLHQCHRFDPDVDMHEIVRAFDDLIRQGKLLYWGVSEWPAEAIRHACDTARLLGACPPFSNQPLYNIAARRIELNRVQATCRDYGLGMVTFSPLAQGLLTGKYSGGNIPPDSRAADDALNTWMPRITRESTARVDKLRPIAERHGISLAQLAIAWILPQTAVTSVIIGASKPEQLKENLTAAKTRLSEQDLRAIDELFPAQDDA